MTKYTTNVTEEGLPWWLSGEEPACQCHQRRDRGSKSHPPPRKWQTPGGAWLCPIPAPLRPLPQTGSHTCTDEMLLQRPRAGGAELGSTPAPPRGPGHSSLPPKASMSSSGKWESEHLSLLCMALNQMGLRTLPLPTWRRQWHPTPVLLPGKSHEWKSLIGCSPCGR